MGETRTKVERQLQIRHNVHADNIPDYLHTVAMTLRWAQQLCRCAEAPENASSGLAVIKIKYVNCQAFTRGSKLLTVAPNVERLQRSPVCAEPPKDLSCWCVPQKHITRDAASKQFTRVLCRVKKPNQGRVLGRAIRGSGLCGPVWQWD